MKDGVEILWPLSYHPAQFHEARDNRDERKLGRSIGQEKDIIKQRLIRMKRRRMKWQKSDGHRYLATMVEKARHLENAPTVQNEKVDSPRNICTPFLYKTTSSKGASKASRNVALPCARIDTRSDPSSDKNSIISSHSLGIIEAIQPVFMILQRHLNSQNSYHDYSCAPKLVIA
ncbi:hypothetical protein QAD02_017656 [Eretmocerus hayati]|uniref:Uncharacterized protein n=1 Tax=Eretmocerus hayati TaxID=131215 RepID=A0ACC2PE77_9HYME|nr:hypothetical protein QAD02_017656 [Eretmocerus hayati]